MSTNKKYISTSLKRGLDILQLFDKENSSFSLSEISKELGVSRSVPYRLLYTLKEEGYIVQNDITKRYTLSPKVLSLGYSYINSLKIPDLIQPYLEEIRHDINASCYLSVLDKHHVVYIGSAPVKDATGINVNIGTRLPAYATANGKVLLAYHPNKIVEEILDTEEIYQFTSYTSKYKEQLINELKIIREQGYAKTEKEYIDFISSVAIPVFDNHSQIVASINIVVPNTSFDDNFLMDIALPKLLDIGKKINTF